MRVVTMSRLFALQRIVGGAVQNVSAYDTSREATLRLTGYTYKPGFSSSKATSQRQRRYSPESQA